MASNALECEFCKKQFSVKNSLNVHQRTAKYCLALQGKHADEVFSCDFCNKSFTLKQTYQEHLLICKTKNSLELNKKYQDYQSCIDQLKSELKIKEFELKTRDDELKAYEFKSQELDYYKKQFDEQTQKNNDLMLMMKEQEILLKERERYILKIEESLHKANQTIAEIAMQPKTTNNSDNRIHHQQNITNNFDINDIAKITSVLDKHLTTDVIRRGQEGVAEMLKTHLLQTETGEPVYECTDVARQKFEFRNADGNIETDPNATKLIRNLGKSGMWNKAHATGKKLWEKEDGTVNKDAQQVFMPRVTEVMEIGKDSTKLRRRLASITARQPKRRT
jgi:hypothetical protein